MLGHYFTSALRGFARRPLSTAIKLLALGLGFGCCLTANVIADYVERADRQWASADRIYAVSQAVTAPGSDKESGATIGAISWPAVEFLKADFPDLVVSATQTVPLPARVEGKQENGNKLIVDPEFVRVFGLHMLSGSSDALTTPTGVLLEAAAARELFGA